MRLTRAQLLTAVTLSLGVHVAGAAIFISREETIEIAGGAANAELVIGTAFADSLQAGETGDVLKPVDVSEDAHSAQTPTAEAEFVETAKADAQPTETAVLPAPSETLIASEDTPDEPRSVSSDEIPAIEAAPDKPEPSPLNESLPAHTEELDALAPADEITPVADPEPELALPENVPVPVARPELPEARSAKSRAPAPDRQKAAEPRPQETKPAERATQRASAKPSKAGDGGKQKTTASKASSGSATAKRTTAAGNAAVSNYPGKVASKLRRSLRYPREARQQRIRGDVVVSFVVAGNGGVSSIRITRSSGSAVLDEAARDAVRRAAPFPPIPADASRASWPFSVPLGFTR